MSQWQQMFANKTPIQTAVLRGGAKDRSLSNMNTAPDPIKDAYKLKSQIDAVQKSQQSFKTSEIIQIQTKLLTKAWKWISKYGIGSLNQYTKMKKQIANYDILINKISTMHNNMENNFNALHRISKHHSISLNHIKSNLCTNHSYLKQIKNNQSSHDHDIEIEGNNNENIENIENNEKNEIINNNDDDQLEHLELPLTMNQINDNDNDQMVLLSEQLSPHIVSNNLNHSEYDIYHQMNNMHDDDKKQRESDHSDHDNDDNDDEHDNMPQLDIDSDPLYPKSSKSTITRSLDNVETVSVQTIDFSAYKFQPTLRIKHNSPLLFDERDREESVIKYNEKSMMKKNMNHNNNNDNNHNMRKLQKGKSDGTYNNNKEGIDHFSCTDKENVIQEEIMENLTKLEGISNDFNSFIEKECDRIKQETEQIIKSKLKPLHEILHQREMGLLSELRYLHKEKTVKMRQKQHMIQQNKNFLKMKLVECQKILQQYQTKWDIQYQILTNQYKKIHNMHNYNNYNNNNNNNDDDNILYSPFLSKDHQFAKKVENIKMNLIKERKQQLMSINNEVIQQIEVKVLQRDISNIKQMYIFTVNSANLHSLKEKLQNLGEFVDFAQNYKNGKLSRAFTHHKNKKLLKTKAGTVGIVDYNTFDIDENEAHQRKFSNIINKKFNEFIGRKMTQSPTTLPSNQSSNQPSIYSDGGMNLDHINAVDAESISSGNPSDNDDDININLHSNLSVQHNDMQHNDNKNNNNINNNNNDNNNNGNRVSIDNSAPSEVMTDLP